MFYGSDFKCYFGFSLTFGRFLFLGKYLLKHFLFLDEEKVVSVAIDRNRNSCRNKSLNRYRKQKYQDFGSLWTETKTERQSKQKLNRNCFLIKSKDWIKRKRKRKLILKPKITSYESSMMVYVFVLPVIY